MKNFNYKPRIIDEKIKKYLNTFGAILIEGPKWCGKTWSAKNICSSEFLLANPNGNFNNKRIAILNPELALQGSIPRLIDEWQEVPSLWDAIRGKIDENSQKGQFILTGSASINKNKYIHSGTGRIARLKMRPMSLFENGYSDGKISLKDISRGIINDFYTGNINLESLVDFVLCGGWPGNLNLNTNQSINFGC